MVGKVVEGRTIMKLSSSQKQNVTITSALISEAINEVDVLVVTYVGDSIHLWYLGDAFGRMITIYCLRQ